MRTDQNRKSYITAAGARLNCVLSVGAAAQEASDAVPSSTAESSRVVAAQIEPDLERFVDQQPRLPDQAQHILVRVTPAPVRASFGSTWTQGICLKLQAFLGKTLAKRSEQLKMRAMR